MLYRHNVYLNKRSSTYCFPFLHDGVRHGLVYGLRVQRFIGYMCGSCGCVVRRGFDQYVPVSNMLYAEVVCNNLQMEGNMQGGQLM